MKSKFFFGTLVIAIAFALSPSIVHAGHDGNGYGTGHGSGNVPVPADKNNEHGSINNGGNYNNGVKKKQAPFDGGLSVLAGAGLLYGFKRARDKRKKANSKI